MEWQLEHSNYTNGRDLFWVERKSQGFEHVAILCLAFNKHYYLRALQYLRKRIPVNSLRINF